MLISGARTYCLLHLDSSAPESFVVHSPLHSGLFSNVTSVLSCCPGPSYLKQHPAQSLSILWFYFSNFIRPINRILVYYTSPSIRLSATWEQDFVFCSLQSPSILKTVKSTYCVFVPYFQKLHMLHWSFSHQKALSCFTFIQSNDCETEGLEPTDSKAHDSDPHETAKLKGQVKKSVWGENVCVCVWWWRNIHVC